MQAEKKQKKQPWKHAPSKRKKPAENSLKTFGRKGKTTKGVRQMIKIAHVKEVESLKLPQEVVRVIEHIGTVLDNEYGKERDVDGGDGGYILVIESNDDFDKLKDIYINMEDVIAEYVDLIKVTDGEDYTNSLIILNNDFAISLIIPLAITPKRLLDEININD